MRICINLSHMQDVDLVCLASSRQFDLRGCVLHLIQCYATGMPLPTIRLPQIDPPRGEIPDLSIYLSVTDKDSCEWLKSLRKGVRNGAIKSLLRNALEAPCFAWYSERATISLRRENETYGSPSHAPLLYNENKKESVPEEMKKTTIVTEPRSEDTNIPTNPTKKRDSQKTQVAEARQEENLIPVRSTQKSVETQDTSLAEGLNMDFGLFELVDNY